jgi:hypothetical protein
MNQDFLSSLTLDEVETIENLSGTPLDELLTVGKLKGKALKAVIWVAKRREDANFKMEDAGKVTFAEALKLFEVDASDPKGL